MKTKMKINIISVLIVLIAIAMFDTVSAQTDTTKFTRFKLTNGEEVNGIVLTEDDEQVIVKSTSGIEMKISKNLISEAENYHALIRDGKFVRSDPNSTRLFFAPTAKTLRKGKGYFSVYEIFLPFIAYGVTDYITLKGE